MWGFVMVTPGDEPAGTLGKLGEAVEYGAARDAQDASDLAVVQAIDVMQPRGRAQLGGAARDDPCGRIAIRQHRLDVLADRFGNVLLDLLVQLAIADLVQAVVRRDAIDPGERLP